MTTLVLATDAPVVAGPPQGRWTHADWETLPDDGSRYEIIDGVLYKCLPTITVPMHDLFAGAPDTTL